MDDYVDLTLIQKKLRNGQYMSMFGFSQDVRNIWNKAQAYMSEDEKVMKALKIMKEKFKELSKELE
jgi:hypothetical protein